ncbi:MAG: prephenate dehydrogenase [Bacteroidales bacterium]|jgi:prephenate dehydrogenase|nr:prephenate dehydrogenase [Bacteroidales bacterium]
MNITIIGTGLIGGSMAMGIRGFQTHIVGVDKNPANTHKALELGIVDEVAELDDAITRCDLCVLAIPVDGARQIITHVLDGIPEQSVVIDVGSTKAGICKVVENHPKRGNFVASHPMAGTENSGPEAAFADLFKRKKTIICEAELSSDFALKQAQTLYSILGMNILYMSPEEHDKHIAYVSHLTHVIAYALSLTVQEIEKDEKAIFEMAGSGFDSTVRIAKSSTDMWTPIFQQNADFLTDSIDKYIDVLQRFKQVIADKNNDALYDLIKEANKIRAVLDK